MFRSRKLITPIMVLSFVCLSCATSYAQMSDSNDSSQTHSTWITAGLGGGLHEAGGMISGGLCLTMENDGTIYSFRSVYSAMVRSSGGMFGGFDLSYRDDVAILYGTVLSRSRHFISVAAGIGYPFGLTDPNVSLALEAQVFLHPASAVRIGSYLFGDFSNHSSGGMLISLQFVL